MSDIADYIVTKVRMEPSEDGTHEHVAGLCTSGGRYDTRGQVYDSIEQGDVWKTLADGREATIQPIVYCTHPAGASPPPTSRPTRTAARARISRTSNAANGAPQRERA